VLVVEVADRVKPGRPRLEWRKEVEKNVLKVGLLYEDVLDGSKWRDGISRLKSLEVKR